ncbi:MAG: histidine phosphatase family protein [Parahaliea sp.]
MATLYLIRHGQASFGSDDYDKLSALGCRQAEFVGEYFSGQDIHFDAVYSGDLLRQRETTEYVLKKQPGAVPHHIDVRFNEIDNDAQLKHILPIVAEHDERLRAVVDRGLSSSKDYQKAIEAIFNYWVSPECNIPQLQSWNEYSCSVHDALIELVNRYSSGKTIAIFTSGGTIATIVSLVLGIDSQYVYRFYEPIFNCSISQFFYNENKISLSSFNDCSFLRLLEKQKNEKLVTYR